MSAARRTTGDRWHDRVESGNWAAIAAEVDEYGGALLLRLLAPEETEETRGLYGQGDRFRSTVDMTRHRFGRGEHRYFHAPYPEPVERLKQALYPRLLPIARDWWTKLGRPAPVRHGVSARFRQANGTPSPSCMTYTLLDADGRLYQSRKKGRWGGHRASRIYGRLDCPCALRAIARGGYAKHRVFFADEVTAAEAGFRPCGCCCKDLYRSWKAAQENRERWKP